MNIFLLECFQVDALGNFSVNSRTKRALYHRYGHHSSKLSAKDLAVELVKKAYKSHLLMILFRNIIKSDL